MEVTLNEIQEHLFSIVQTYKEDEHEGRLYIENPVSEPFKSTLEAADRYKADFLVGKYYCRVFKDRDGYVLFYWE